MANLLQSSQTQATSAPQYFTDYLSNLASSGTNAATNAQYVGAQPLQEQAFNMVGQNAGQFQAPITSAEDIATNAANTNVMGAAQPYLAGASRSGGLNAAVPYLNQATQSPAELAQQYMNPFINSAVQNMSDIAQRNIQQNLAPQATAAAVGSGQFGSQRGAQVQGQVVANAEQDLNSQIANLLSSGYGQALTAAGQQNNLLGQLGSTAGNLGQQQANLLGQLGSTAATAASNQGQLENTAAQNLGALGTAGQNMSLADINALSTLGGQQQTIAQNKQLFPLQNLSTLSGLLKGYSMPTTTTTTANSSPLSTLAGLGTGTLAMFTPGANGTTPFDNLKTAWNNLTGGSSSTAPSSNDAVNAANPYLTGGAGTGTYDSSATGGASGGSSDSTATGGENYSPNYYSLPNDYE